MKTNLTARVLRVLGVSSHTKEGRRKFRRLRREAMRKYEECSPHEAIDLYCQEIASRHIRRSDWTLLEDGRTYLYYDWTLSFSGHPSHRSWFWRLFRRGNLKGSFHTPTPYFPTWNLAPYLFNRLPPDSPEAK